MAIRPRKLASGKVAYWLALYWRGQQEWEHGGFDKDAARRLHTQRKAEIKAGTYVPRFSEFTKVGPWLDDYMGKRQNRTADNERNLIRDHVRGVEWFCAMRVCDVKPRDVERLVLEMRAAGRLGEKSISYVFSIVSGAFTRAVFEQLITASPCQLPKGTIRRRARNKRQPYTRAEVRAILACERIPLAFRVWLALAFYTGMREGEVCGRRFRDWVREAHPLTALFVHSQYDDQPLKGDDAETTRPRVVPVHGELERILNAWWSDGFELVFLRRPTPDDFIVPTGRAQINHTKSSAYKAFRRALAAAGVENRSLHSTRHTFISVARSSRQASEVVERITHNAAGETIDDYTEFEWNALCEVIEAVDYSVDRIAKPAFLKAPAPGLEAGASDADEADSPSNATETEGDGDPPILGQKQLMAALMGASPWGTEHDLAVALAEHPGARPPLKPPIKTAPYVARKRVRGV